MSSAYGGEDGVHCCTDPDSVRWMQLAIDYTDGRRREILLEWFRPSNTDTPLARGGRLLGVALSSLSYRGAAQRQQAPAWVVSHQWLNTALGDVVGAIAEPLMREALRLQQRAYDVSMDAVYLRASCSPLARPCARQGGPSCAVLPAVLLPLVLARINRDQMCAARSADEFRAMLDTLSATVRRNELSTDAAFISSLLSFIAQAPRAWGLPSMSDAALLAQQDTPMSDSDDGESAGAAAALVSAGSATTEGDYGDEDDDDDNDTYPSSDDDDDSSDPHEAPPVCVAAITEAVLMHELRAMLLERRRRVVFHCAQPLDRAAQQLWQAIHDLPGRPLLLQVESGASHNNAGAPAAVPH